MSSSYGWFADAGSNIEDSLAGGDLG